MSLVRRDSAHSNPFARPREPGIVFDEPVRVGTFSIVVPAKDEAANLPQLVEEIIHAFRPMTRRSGGRHRLEGFEILVVDDGSTDGTAELLERMSLVYPELRPVFLPKNVGQSAATVAGFRLARGDWVGMLDADLQNPPADLAAMWDVLPGYDAALGWRMTREDVWTRRVISRFSNWARNALLGQAVRDTGCSVRIMGRDLALRLPMFRGGHRFFGPLLIREGARIVQIPVTHRPRTRGKSHYHFGNRSVRVVVDLLGVAWLLRRPIRFEVVRSRREMTSQPLGLALVRDRETQG